MVFKSNDYFLRAPSRPCLGTRDTVINKAGVIQPTYSFVLECVRKKEMEKEVVWCGHKQERKGWFEVFGACHQGSEAVGFGDIS